MRNSSILVGLVAIALVICALVAPAQASDRAWERDTALLEQVFSELRAGGILAVGPHAGAIEKALKAAKPLFKKPQSDGGTTFILTDGQQETLVALAAAAGSGEVAAVFNPYPTMGLYLGSFYVETGKYRDALRVLDAGLALSPLPNDLLGQTVPDLLAERGIALGKLKRLDQALASYDTALGIGQMDRKMRAILHRGRGFVLIEMGRLDDAQVAYEQSLKLDPGNKIALGELAYITGLREGQEPTETLLTMPGKKY
jgi:tetratricopeptide (TPR) repeat protein